VGDALAFVRPVEHASSPSTVETCSSYAYTWVNCFGQEGCTYLAGQRTCRTVDSGPEYCHGGFATCTDHAGADPTCVPEAFEDVEGLVDTWCYTQTKSRDTIQFQIRVLNLSDPDNPSVAPSVTLPVQDEGVSMLARGDNLYITVKQPAVVPGDTRPYARYYFRRLNLSDPSDPELGPAINVPGELLSVDGNKAFTRDIVWGDQFMETAIARVKLKHGLAQLQNYEVLPDREVVGLAMDDKHAVAVHQPVWDPYGYWNGYGRRLSILKPSGNGGAGAGFTTLSDLSFNLKGTLLEAREDRALFWDWGGVLMLNLEDAENPQAQAYFPSHNWKHELVFDEGEILYAAGPFGIHQLDLDDSNLVTSITP
jgi:hypothetical protein